MTETSNHRIDLPPQGIEAWKDAENYKYLIGAVAAIAVAGLITGVVHTHQFVSHLAQDLFPQS